MHENNFFFFIFFPAIYAQTHLSLSDNFDLNSSYLYNEPSLYQADIKTDKTLTFRSGHSVGNIGGQFFCSIIVGGLAAIAPLSATWALAYSGSNAAGPVFLLTVAVYIMGTATGSYLVARYENREISFWPTVLASTTGAAFGVITGMIIDQQDAGGAAVFALFCPTIASIIYTTLIADFTPAYEMQIRTKRVPKLSFSHKDLIQNSKLLEVNLLHIRL